MKQKNSKLSYWTDSKYTTIVIYIWSSKKLFEKKSIIFDKKIKSLLEIFFYNFRWTSQFGAFYPVGSAGARESLRANPRATAWFGRKKSWERHCRTRKRPSGRKIFNRSKILPRRQKTPSNFCKSTGANFDELRRNAHDRKYLAWRTRFGMLCYGSFGTGSDKFISFGRKSEGHINWAGRNSESETFDRRYGQRNW